MSLLSKIFDRINVSTIFSNHLSTFYHYEKLQFYNKKEVPTSDIIIFGVAPILIAILLSYSKMFFTKEYVAIILTCLSIFTGLLFGFLTMAYNLVQENQKIKIDDINIDNVKKTKAKIDLTVHLFINIAFSIVLSIFALIAVLLSQFYPLVLIHKLKLLLYYSILKQSYLYIINGIAFFLLIEFILVLLMILRRFMVLFLNQVSITQS